MKIRDRLPSGVAGTGAVRPKDKLTEAAGAASAAKTSDSVHISGRSLEIQRARLAALQAPDIRQEMVDEIVALIGTGQYTVTGAEVAPKMIREHMMDAGR